MTRRGLLLADGPSDLPLAGHLEVLCATAGNDVAITAVDPERLSPGDRTVAGRLEWVLAQQPEAVPDVIFIHRDAETERADRRREEIDAACRSVGLSCPVVPIVPVRMTEAWLLLDEGAIRTVAGRPTGRQPLDLPTPREAERMADPKSRLRDVLLAASELSGRRRTEFQRQFGVHRRLLLQRLDPNGRVTELDAWQQLRRDIDDAMRPRGTERGNSGDLTDG